jgi:hypothetical protein
VEDGGGRRTVALGGEPEEAVPPDELFERLQPFKERVAEDIRATGEEQTDG